MANYIVSVTQGIDIGMVVTGDIKSAISLNYKEFAVIFLLMAMGFLFSLFKHFLTSLLEPFSTYSINKSVKLSGSVRWGRSITSK